MIAAGAVMAVAIALHNLPEGMVIGASFANGSSSASLPAAVLSWLPSWGSRRSRGHGGLSPSYQAAWALPSRSTGRRLRSPNFFGRCIRLLYRRNEPADAFPCRLPFAGGAMLYVVFTSYARIRIASAGKIPAFSMIAPASSQAW